MRAGGGKGREEGQIQKGHLPRLWSQGPARAVMWLYGKLGRRWGGQRALGKAALQLPAEAVKGFRVEIYEQSCAPKHGNLAPPTVWSDLGVVEAAACTLQQNCTGVPGDLV